MSRWLEESEFEESDESDEADETAEADAVEPEPPSQGVTYKRLENGKLVPE